MTITTRPATSSLRDALAVQEGEPYFVAELGLEPDYPLRAEAAREGVVGMAALPLRFAGEVIGSIVLFHDRVREYPEEERGIAGAFAEIAALAIGKSRLLDQVVERAQVLVGEPECGCEAMASIAMNGGAQAPLHVADGAGADAGSLCQLLLGHPGSQAKPFQ